MSLRHRYFKTQPDYKSVRPFDCEGILTKSEGYDCTVEVVKINRVRIAFGSTDFSVKSAVAKEMVECLRDAFNVTLFGYEDPWDERSLAVKVFDRYRPSSDLSQLVAKGDVAIRHASEEFFGQGTGCGTTEMKIQSMAGGGFEFVFDFKSYPFSFECAAWLCFRLREACMHISQTLAEMAAQRIAS